MWRRFFATNAAKKQYQSTLNLPKTSFPMRANAVQREPGLVKEINDAVFAAQAAHRNRPLWITHDGPPYANGDPHLGHLLNKVLKDVINRFKVSVGYRVDYRPGWDTHGLPIEMKAAAKPGDSPMDIRRRAKQIAGKAIKIQKQGFERWGVMGDYANAYLTMHPAYEAAELRVFASFLEKGLIYRAEKPVYWSPATKTALAEAELEYVDSHTSLAAYVAFPLNLQGKEEIGLASSSSSSSSSSTTAAPHALIWTTTPWTLLGNRAICLSPTEDYALYGGEVPGRSWLLATAAVPRLRETLQWELPLISDIRPGSWWCAQSTYAFPSNLPPVVRNGRTNLPLLPGRHVSADSGTGVVHTAPAYGPDDFTICRDLGLLTAEDPVHCYVDAQGMYQLPEVRELHGLSVVGAAGNEAMLNLWEDAIVQADPYAHRYPYDWRSKTPVIFRCVPQWFINVSPIVKEAELALQQAHFVPESGANRLSAMLSSRPHWCISRQRYWGVPIPCFYTPDGQVQMDSEIVEHVAKVLEREGGSDAWFTLPVEQLLPPSRRKEGADWIKSMDTLDVWFDSGVSTSAVLDGKVADLILEGSDQHRGWFQSSLLLAAGRTPWNNVVTHGFVLDANGRKMSKSLGNVVAPTELLKEHGADVLRLWVATTDFTSDVSLSPEALTRASDALRKLRNTCRFLLGATTHAPGVVSVSPTSSLCLLDRWFLHRTWQFRSEYIRAMDQFAVARATSLLFNYCSRDLSATYMEMIKDRLYADPTSSPGVQHVQHALLQALRVIQTSLSPLVPFLAWDVHQHCSWSGKPTAFGGSWIEDEEGGANGDGEAKREAIMQQLLTEEEAAMMQEVLRLRSAVLRSLESARGAGQIGSSVLADIEFVPIEGEGEGEGEGIQHPILAAIKSPQLQDHLSAILVVAEARVAEKPSTQTALVETTWENALQIRVLPARGHACPRCWRAIAPAPEVLCARCAGGVMTSQATL
jgi:isoleucyl-tRNA synthetase